MKTQIDKTLVQTKIWKETRAMLRMLYAITGEQMVSIIHRLAVEELKKIQGK